MLGWWWGKAQWMNVYHGGTKPAPYDQHTYIDNVVMARQHIGSTKAK